jgi:hypothetical protein
MAGCASRTATNADGWIKPVADLYSRNWIVAGPTLAGNVIGGVLGAPVYFGMGAFAHCEDPLREETCNWASENMGYALVFPGIAVGAVTGAPFIPFSMLAPERPVENLL